MLLRICSQNEKSIVNVQPDHGHFATQKMYNTVRVWQML